VGFKKHKEKIDGSIFFVPGSHEHYQNQSLISIKKESFIVYSHFVSFEDVSGIVRINNGLIITTTLPFQTLSFPGFDQGIQKGTGCPLKTCGHDVKT
jgi:hypothetical protein